MKHQVLLIALACTARSLSAQSTVPFCAGVTVVSAVNDIKGDYESIVTLQSIESDRVNLHYSSEVQSANSVNLISASRVVLMRDMANARLLHNWYSQYSQRAYPGTTSYQASAAVLRNLKSRGTAEIGLVDRNNSEVPADRSKHPNIFDFEHVFPLHRTSSGTVAVPVIVNSSRTQLPAVTASGEFMGDKVDFAFLDDALHPITLSFTYTPLGGKPISVRAVKISYHCRSSNEAANAMMSALEKSLLELRKADVYQIYFDFNSDRIREESAPALDDIAQILKRHPDWKLAINGHTDNIGGDAYNIPLSRKRAVSVKNYLVERYGIQSGRLTTGGAGAAQPKATNATIEGRAQNRRVELIRT
jgi:outer membrane protein OmpA-like peptidoglycan-associated protein